MSDFIFVGQNFRHHLQKISSFICPTKNVVQRKLKISFFSDPPLLKTGITWYQEHLNILEEVFREKIHQNIIEVKNNTDRRYRIVTILFLLIKQP